MRPEPNLFWRRGEVASAQAADSPVAVAGGDGTGLNFIGASIGFFRSAADPLQQYIQPFLILPLWSGIL